MTAAFTGRERGSRSPGPTDAAAAGPGAPDDDILCLGSFGIVEMAGTTGIKLRGRINWRRRDPRSPKGIEKPASLEVSTPEVCQNWRRRESNPCGNKSITCCWRMTSLPNRFAARVLLPSIESPGVLLSPLESTCVVETLWRRRGGFPPRDCPWCSPRPRRAVHPRARPAQDGGVRRSYRPPPTGSFRFNSAEGWATSRPPVPTGTDVTGARAAPATLDPDNRVASPVSAP